MKKNIALVYGGDSSEFEVSVKSAGHVVQHIDPERYTCYNVLIKGSDWRAFLPSLEIVETIVENNSSLDDSVASAGVGSTQDAERVNELSSLDDDSDSVGIDGDSAGVGSLGVDSDSVGIDGDSLDVDGDSVGIDGDSAGVGSLGVDSDSVGIDGDSAGVGSLGVDSDSVGIDGDSAGVGSVGYRVDKSDFSFVIPNDKGMGGTRIKFDKVLIMIHGNPGENGLLQAYLELAGVPFVSSPASVSLLTFNKYACKCYMGDTGVKLPGEVFLRKGDIIDSEAIVASLGLPLFVKPNSGGSSFGATKVKRIEDLRFAVEKAFGEDDSVLVEEYIDGRELTNGVYFCESGSEKAVEIGSGKAVVLPVTEIIPEGEYFDFAAKYEGASQEICPARIPDELALRIKELSLKIFRHLGCRGFARVDYIVRGEDIYFLEINTVPGMTEMSLVPQQIRAAGMTIKEFFNDLLG